MVRESNNKLEEAIRRRLSDPERFIVSTAPVFGGFLWEGDFSLEEVVALEHAVIADASQSPRRVVLQTIRGEIRYYITDDHSASASAYTEDEGIVDSLAAAADLCFEFLTTNISPFDLQTEHRSLCK